MNFSDIVKALNPKESQIFNDYLINRAVFDTRSSQFFKNSIFFTLGSEKRDGHRFIQEAYEKGIKSFVLERKEYVEDLKDINYCIVDNALIALQAIASQIRESSGLEIIAITGSNGKTIVKEWLSQILSPTFQIVKSPKSYNSQIGVPLSVWQISERHQMGIFEAGISRLGEMSTLHNILKPQIGILTNIGSAHDEGFKDRDEKLNEKLELFRKAKKLIVREQEYEKVMEKKRELGIGEIISWGISNDNKYQIEMHRQKHSVVHVNDYEFQVHFSDLASLENVSHCIIAAIELGLSNDIIQDQLNQLPRLQMRLEVKEGENGCIIIDDTYNHDEAGLRIAAEYLAGQYPKMAKSIIISDLAQSGLEQKNQLALFNEIFEGVKLKNKIIIGPNFRDLPEIEKAGFLHFETIENFKNNLPEFKDEVILIKGSRQYKFESIVKSLEKKIHGTRLEINLSALSHNLNYFKSMLDPKTKLMVMVKAFAYGLGSREVSNLLEFHQVDYLGVAYANEGVELRKLGVGLPIFVMNPSSESLTDCFEYNLEPEIFSFKSLEEFIQTTNAINSEIPIHINVDTGMKRLGFDINDITKLGKILKSSNIRVASIFSHLSSSDDSNEKEFTLNQAGTFDKAYKELTDLLGYKPLKHLVNSAGIINFPELHYDMVRLGIGLYGINNTRIKNNPLQTIGRLISEISQIKEISKVDSIGYNRKGKLPDGGRIATIPIGYADGYLRVFSNGQGKVLINGQMAPLIGNVCMDMCMVNISHINAEEGDEVIIFGENPSVEDLAKWAKTIPYEILTNVSERVKRIYITD